MNLEEKQRLNELKIEAIETLLESATANKEERSVIIAIENELNELYYQQGMLAGYW